MARRREQAWRREGAQQREGAAEGGGASGGGRGGIGPGECRRVGPGARDWDGEQEGSVSLHSGRDGIQNRIAILEK